MPWVPGGRPVPSELRLVTVVAGNPAESACPDRASSARNGAAAGLARSSSQPMPSMTTRQARSAAARRRGLASPSMPSEASTEVARSASVLSP